jgi:hypothetical protein
MAKRGRKKGLKLTPKQRASRKATDEARIAKMGHKSKKRAEEIQITISLSSYEEDYRMPGRGRSRMPGLWEEKHGW